MEIRALDHVQLAMPVGGEAAAQRFYGDVLGLPRVPKPPHLASRGGCWFEHGDLKVHLGVEADFRPATKAHPAFVVEDLTGLLVLLTAGGHPVIEGEPLAGYDRAYTTDPFGNRIEFLEPEASPT